MKTLGLCIVLSGGLLAAQARYTQPLYFETGKPGVFVARTQDRTVRVSAGSIEFGGTARMRLLGARPNAPSTALDRQPGVSNHFTGNDPGKWRTGIPHFGSVRFSDVYPGVDLVYHGDAQQIEYDFALAPHADSRLLRLTFDGVSHLALDDAGDLTVSTAGETLRFRKPAAYQEGREVEAAFTLDRGKVGFRLGRYDKSKLLVIDPTLVYATNFGGSRGAGAFGVTADAAGNVYIVGSASSSDFVPAGTTVPCQLDGPNCFDVFVMKLSPAGSGVYTTFIGGSGVDTGFAIAIDAAGNAYITGVTQSANFPTLNPFQAVLHGTQNAFVAKLNAAGTLVYSTYFGGAATVTFYPPDGGTGIAVDAAGNATVGGATTARDLPTLNPFQSTPGAGFIAKLNASGSALVYSSYFDGTVNAVAGDSAGNAYIAGSSSSTTPSTPGAAQSTNGGGFLAKIGATGSLVYTTLLGGAAEGVSLDPSGNVYLTGSSSPALALVNALYSTPLSSFVAKVNPAGSAFLYSTYWHGRALGIAVDAAGNAYVAGQAIATDPYPLVNALQSAPIGAISPAPNGSPNSVLAKFSPDGSQLLYSTYFGGETEVQLNAVAVDGAGNAYFTGSTSLGFPALNSIKPATGGSFVAKIADANPMQCVVFLPTTVSNTLVGPGGTGTFTVTANSGGCTWQATTSTPWITITSGASGSGIGVVGFSASLNTTLSPRGGQITVNGMTFTVNQAVASHVDAGSVDGAAGSIARVPVTLVENEGLSTNQELLTLTFSVTPAPPGALSFQPTPLLPAPQTSSSGPGMITLTWPTPFVSISNGPLGELIVPIPSTATAGQTFTVMSTGGQAMLSGSSFYDPFAPGAPGTVTVGNPAPALTTISPSSATPGSAAFTITVRGEGFAPASTVLWNGVALATTFVSETALQGSVPGSDLTTAGSATVTVSNGAPGGGASTALTFLVTTATAPAITVAGIVNAAGYTTQVTGNDIAAIFGVNLAPSVSSPHVIPLLTALNTVSVLVDGIPAPLFYLSPGQINFQTPFRLLNQTQATIVVQTNGISSNAVTIPLVAAAPALLAVNGQGTGQGEVLAVNGAFVAPTGTIFGAQPGVAGQAISIYCLGLGAVTGTTSDGFGGGPNTPTLANPQVTIGGLNANVTFSGEAPGFVGLYQVNVVIPAGVASSPSIPVVFSMNGLTSNTVTIAIQ